MSSGGWTALAACVTAAVAVIAAVIGRGQLREARTLREAQAQPQVVVYLDESGNHPTQIDLVIKNFGATAATDVRVTFSDSLESANLKRPIKVPALIPVLVPGQDWRAYWDFTEARVKAKLPTHYTATVEFNTAVRREKPYAYTFDVDWQPVIDRGFINVYTMHDLAESIDRIRTRLDGWGDFSGGLKVVTRDGDKKDQRMIDELESRRDAEQPDDQG